MSQEKIFKLTTMVIIFGDLIGKVFIYENTALKPHVNMIIPTADATRFSSWLPWKPQMSNWHHFHLGYTTYRNKSLCNKHMSIQSSVQEKYNFSRV